MFTLALCAKAVLGQQSNLTALDVLSCPLLRNKGAILTTALTNFSVKNISFCLWVNIQSWSSTVKLVRSKSFLLYLLPLDKDTGHFQIFKDDKSSHSVAFRWSQAWSVSSKSWNSICVTYNAAIRLLSIAINGHVVKNTFLFKAEAIEKFELPTIALAGNHSYVARITNFNAWSRPLSLEEVLTFASGSSMAAQTRPGVNVIKTFLSEFRKSSFHPKFKTSIFLYF